MGFKPDDDIAIEAKHFRWPDGKGLAFLGSCKERRTKTVRVRDHASGGQLDCHAVHVFIVRHGLDECAMVIIKKIERINNTEIIRVKGYLPSRKGLAKPLITGL